MALLVTNPTRTIFFKASTFPFNNESNNITLKNTQSNNVVLALIKTGIFPSELM